MTNPTFTSDLKIDDFTFKGEKVGDLEVKVDNKTANTLAANVALSDEGRPSYDKDLANKLANLGVPSFACSPDLFPTLMACAIKREDINQWAATQGIITSRGQKQ